MQLRIIIPEKVHVHTTFLTVVDAQFRYGDIRLADGSYQWEGRVEIYISGTWGTITDSDWNSKDAKVVCRKLGYFKPGMIHGIFFDYITQEINA